MRISRLPVWATPSHQMNMQIPPNICGTWSKSATQSCAAWQKEKPGDTWKTPVWWVKWHMSAMLVVNRCNRKVVKSTLRGFALRKTATSDRLWPLREKLALRFMQLLDKAPQCSKRQWLYNVFANITSTLPEYLRKEHKTRFTCSLFLRFRSQLQSLLANLFHGRCQNTSRLWCAFCRKN